MGQQHPVPLLTEGVCRIGLATEHKAEGGTQWYGANSPLCLAIEGLGAEGMVEKNRQD